MIGLGLEVGVGISTVVVARKARAAANLSVRSPGRRLAGVHAVNSVATIKATTSTI
jgi:hypothetical protein